MNISRGFAGREDEIADLFAEVFAASEGDEEGAMIGALVQDLMASTPDEDIALFCIQDDDRLIGAVAFTRMRFSEDDRHVALLSPMAVDTAHQGQGVGQTLLDHALATLPKLGVDVVLTYGDPAFYGKVGFTQITEDQAQAPQPLNMPHGWLGQSLTDDAPLHIGGAPTCAPALDRPDIW